MSRKPVAYSGSEPYIFISYAHADDAVVLPLIAGLQERGFRVWYDEGIEDSVLWQKVIAEHLAKSRCVIAFISRAALASPNCRKEINFAVNLSERPESNHASPLPVYLDDAELDYEMQMVLLPLQSRYYSKYPSIADLLNSLKDSASLRSCRAASDAELCYDRGKALQREGKHAEAVSLIRQAAELGLAAAQCSLGSCCAKGLGVPKDDAEAIRWYRMAARQNHAGAQNNLAFCYYSGKGIQKDHEKAAELYRQAAQQGLAQGQFGLARCYELGHGVEQDLRQAWEWYCRARDDGHVKAAEAAARCEAALRKYAESPEGAFEQAEELYADDHYEEAFALFQKAAQQGYAPAQYWLAICYHNGTGVEVDMDAALEWIHKAVAQGDVDAMEELGSWMLHHYSNGEECRKYWELAVKSGSDYAALWLGEAYQNGSFGKKDPRQALVWYRKAKELGHPDADENIQECEKAITMEAADGWFSEAEKLYKEMRYKKALELYRKAAQYNHPGAEYMLAHCHRMGEGVRSDYPEAMKWYRKAAEHGHANAQYHLGVYCSSPIFDMQDYDAAFRWLSKAADQGHAGAMASLGDCYYYGRGVSQDYKKAYNAYARAYRLDKGWGKLGLGRCYENGHGVEKDLEKALAWYRSADSREGIRRCEEALKKKKKNWWDI